MERFFNTLECRFGALFYSYAGHDARDRPEHMRKTEKQLEKNDNIPTLEIFQEQLENYLKEYNASPHSGKDMSGRTPDEAYYNSIVKEIRTVDADALWILCGKREERKVSNLGIMLFCNTFTNHEGELLKYLNWKVSVIYDPLDMERVYIYSLDGKFICQVFPKIRSLFRGLNEEEFKRQFDDDLHNTVAYVSSNSFSNGLRIGLSLLKSLLTAEIPEIHGVHHMPNKTERRCKPIQNPSEIDEVFIAYTKKF